MRFSRLAAVAGASVLVVGIASCSSTGGKPSEQGGGMGAGKANTPRATVAMITAQRSFETAMQAIATYRRMDDKSMETGRVR